MNRTHRILTLLAANPKKGCTHGDILAAVRAHEPDVPTVTVQVMTHALVTKGRARSTGTRNTRRFFPVEGAFIDRRRTHSAIAPPKPVAPVKAPTRAVAKRPGRSPAHRETADVDGPMDSKRIARDIARFKRQGGRIEKLPMGASARPLGDGHTHSLPLPTVAVRARIRANGGDL